MLVLENLRPILESIHYLLDKKMDKMLIATDEEILELLADKFNLTEGDNIVADENGDIFVL